MQRVKDLMTKKVVTIPEDMRIDKICCVLSNNSLSGVPVVNAKNKLVGFVSESDIISGIASGGYFDTKAKDIMCKKITTITENDLMGQVSKIFASNPFRHLPVLKKGEVVGVISRRDVIKKLI
ncbi:MAG: CBS domain-containing protein [Candidatus Omnitrophota bacterium]